MALKMERLREIVDRVTEKTGEDEETMTLLKEVVDNWESGYTREDVEDERGRRWRDLYDESRRRYRERFYAPEGTIDPPADDVFVEREETETEVKENYDDLFA